jgi:NitT/TauT family transport system permease protein
MARSLRSGRSAPGEAQEGLAQTELLQQAELTRLGSRSKATTQAYLFPVLTFLAILGLWQLASVVLDIPDYLLPAPVEIVQTLVSQQALLLDHSSATLVAILGGFLLSIVIGLPISMLIVYSRHFERSVYPLIVTTQIIPKAAVAPLFVVWFGFGVTPKIVVAFLIAFFPILIATVVGLKSTPREMVQLLRCMGASQLDIFVRARFPHALPSIFGGLKVGITLAVIGAVVGEFVGADEGLGYLIQVSQGAFDSPMLFAALTQLSVIGIILFLLVWAVEWLVLRSREGVGSQ